MSDDSQNNKQNMLFAAKATTNSTKSTNNETTNDTEKCTPAEIKANNDQNIETSKAADAINKAKQEIADAVNKTVDDLKDGIDKITKILSDTSSKDDPDQSSASIQSIIDGLSGVLKKLSEKANVKVPGLSDVSNLFDLKAPSMPNMPDFKLPELPDDIKNTIEDLIAALNSLCTQLSILPLMILYKIVFAILNVTIPGTNVSFMDILKSVPPVDIIDDAIQALPQIYDLVSQMPAKVGTIAKNKIKIVINELANNQVPEAPADLSASYPVDPTPPKPMTPEAIENQETIV